MLIPFLNIYNFFYIKDVLCIYIITVKYKQYTALIFFNNIYMYAFSRRFYPKRLTVHSDYTFFISMCVPWELNPQPFALLTQCSTTEPQEHKLSWTDVVWNQTTLNGKWLRANFKRLCKNWFCCSGAGGLCWCTFAVTDVMFLAHLRSFG